MSHSNYDAHKANTNATPRGGDAVALNVLMGFLEGSGDVDGFWRFGGNLEAQDGYAHDFWADARLQVG